MAYLVPHHTGQFGLAVQVGQDSACEIHVAARHSKGIYDWGVQDLELVRQTRSVRESGHLPSDVVHIGNQFLILVGPIVLNNLPIGLAAQLNFFPLAEQHKLGVPGHRVGCA